MSDADMRVTGSGSTAAVTRSLLPTHDVPQTDPGGLTSPGVQRTQRAQRAHDGLNGFNRNGPPPSCCPAQPGGRPPQGLTGLPQDLTDCRRA